MKEKVSIIVPVYNVEKYLEETLDSICMQTYDNLEIILVNDGSKDNSLDICTKYKLKDDRVVLIDQKNQGVSGARNVGLKKATGEYILFLDGDDLFEKNAVEKLVTQAKDYDLVVCHYSELYVNKKISNMNNDVTLSNKEAIEYLVKPNGYKGFVWGKLFKNDIIKAHSLSFDKDLIMCEDLDFTYNYISCCSGKVLFLGDNLILYRIRKSSITNSKSIKKIESFIKVHDNLIKIFENNNFEGINELYYIYEYEKSKYKVLPKHISDYSKNIKMLTKFKLFVIKNMPTIYYVYGYIKNISSRKFP